MADQTFAIESGFYDAVSGDRTYSADDMNKPYKRLVSNGVFATPYGDPSTDFQVAPYTGLYITVDAGQGIFGDKWVENDAKFTITVPSNNTILPRLDSVLVQVDLRQSGRVANIVYRTGIPATNPQAPAINDTSGVVEYRVANVRVNASASSISASNITDCRGTSECPWITALINQVDTSELYRQWEAAYQEYYDETTEDIDAYFAEKEQAFNDFIEQLTQELTVATNVVVLRSEYVTATDLSQIPIGLPSYDPSTDVLEVFINGFHASPGMDYSLGDGTYITLTAAAPSGQTISFIVFKSLIGSDAASVSSAIQALNDRIDGLASDSGWQDLPLTNSGDAVSFDIPQYRKIGNRVTIRGSVLGSAATSFATLPAGFRPSRTVYLSTAAYNSTKVYPVIISISTTGALKKESVGAVTLTSSHHIPVFTEFYID